MVVQKKEKVYLFLLKMTIPSGGTVIEREWPFPCMGTGVETTPPKLPCPLPPYS
jgi:hypothetical protein